MSQGGHVTAILTYSERAMIEHLACDRSEAAVEERIVAAGVEHSVRLALRALAAGIHLQTAKDRVVVQLSLRTPHGDALYALKLDPQDVRHVPGMALNPDATLMLRLATLLRIVSGDVDGPSALAERRVRVHGDELLSRHILDCFKRARPSTRTASAVNAV